MIALVLLLAAQVDLATACDMPKPPKPRPGERLIIRGGRGLHTELVLTFVGRTARLQPDDLLNLAEESAWASRGAPGCIDIFAYSNDPSMNQRRARAVAELLERWGVDAWRLRIFPQGPRGSWGTVSVLYLPHDRPRVDGVVLATRAARGIPPQPVEPADGDPEPP